MPTTITALIIVALVLTPGYVFTQLIRRVIAHIPEATDGRFFLTIISFGTLIHGLLFVWSTRILTYYLERSLPTHRREVFFWAITTMFVLPVVLGVIIGKVSTWRWVDALLHRIGLGYIDRMPSAWDYVIHAGRPAYVRIHLKDGKGVIGGVYARNSFGALDPPRGDIYLEQGWQLYDDGDFAQPIVDSQGVWVSKDVMAYVEFLNREGENNGQQQPPAADQGRGDQTGLGQEGRPANRNGQQQAAAADTTAPEAKQVGG